MVLQIRETMVLHRVELEGKGSPPHFCVFGPSAAPWGSMVSQKNFTKSRNRRLTILGHIASCTTTLISTFLTA
jgi:hypothetical protein